MGRRGRIKIQIVCLVTIFPVVVPDNRPWCSNCQCYDRINRARYIHVVGVNCIKVDNQVGLRQWNIVGLDWNRRRHDGIREGVRRNGDDVIVLGANNTVYAFRKFIGSQQEAFAQRVIRVYVPRRSHRAIDFPIEIDGDHIIFGSNNTVQASIDELATVHDDESRMILFIAFGACAVIRCAEGLVRTSVQNIVRSAKLAIRSF